MCRVLGVSASGFCRWILVGCPALSERIEEIHTASGGAYGMGYGVPRITARTARGRRRAGRSQASRAAHARAGARRAARAPHGADNRAGKTAPPAPDQVEREFAAPAPDGRWCGDITYLPVGSAVLHTCGGARRRTSSGRSSARLPRNIRGRLTEDLLLEFQLADLLAQHAQLRALGRGHRAVPARFRGLSRGACFAGATCAAARSWL